MIFTYFNLGNLGNPVNPVYSSWSQTHKLVMKITYFCNPATLQPCYDDMRTGLFVKSVSNCLGSLAKYRV